ncbi:Pycsar system effector family protein [Streptomyces canus]|uniref:Pycsar system effector family protein n=1 Tax=Streptomyces canus TaxID=58343 RepID=UPI0033AB036B
MDWYKVAEAKAQLILTVNGVLVTLAFGTAAGHVDDGRDLGRVTGVETWCFFIAVVAALLGAVVCAAACMWSRHGTNYKGTFARLDVNPEDPASYRPEVLWYFGDLAHLEMEAAVTLIGRADRTFEITALSYNVVHLSGIVLRKHRFVNAGWALTALGIASLILGGASVFVRAQI